MEVPPELITIDTFARLWLAVCVVWTVGWVVAAVLGRKSAKGEVATRAILSACGPVGWAMWLLYKGRIAYNPETGVPGLHLVSVLLTNLLIFTAVGIGLGLLIARARRGHENPSAPQETE